MEFIDPTREPGSRVVLAGLYPLIRGTEPYDADASLASLNAECLVQAECTIPGSMVLEEPDLQKLILANQELLRDGVLVLDLRNTVKSFHQLAKEQYGRTFQRPDDREAP
jgi:hypothetical protein